MKKIILGVLIIIIVVTSFFIVYNKFTNEKIKTIQEITGIDFNDISYIKTGGALKQNEDYPVNEFIQEYKNLKYKKLNDRSMGSTTHLYFVCFNSDNEVLFTLVEIGKQDKVFIKKGIFNINEDPYSSLYQLKQ